MNRSAALKDFPSNEIFDALDSFIFGKRGMRKLICSTMLSISCLKASYNGVYCFSYTMVPNHPFNYSSVHPDANKRHFKIKALGFVLESRIMRAIVWYQKKDQQAVGNTGENILRKWRKGVMVTPLINPPSEPNAKGLKMIFKLLYNPHYKEVIKKVHDKTCSFQKENHYRLFLRKDYFLFWVRMKSTLLLEKKRILSWITIIILPLKGREKTLN